MNSGGVAFVLNRELINTKDINITTIEQGRAITLTLKWHLTSQMTLLNIYTPNDYNEHTPFWTNISDQLTYLQIHPDMIMGDFNIVEDPIDRAPTHLDKEDAISALRNLQKTHNMQDTWCHMFPTECTFTFCTHTGTQSRLDRIYALPSHQKNIWKTTPLY